MTSAALEPRMVGSLVHQSITAATRRLLAGYPGIANQQRAGELAAGLRAPAAKPKGQSWLLLRAVSYCS